MLSTWPEERLIATIAAGGGYAQGDNGAVLAALALFPPQGAAALVEHIVTSTAANSPAACGDLLARKAASLPAGGRTGLAGAVIRLIDALPGDPSRAPQRSSWERTPAMPPRLIADLVRAATAVDDGLAQRAVDHVLAWPNTCGFDLVLVPALRLLAGLPEIAAPAASRYRAPGKARCRTADGAGRPDATRHGGMPLP